MSFPIRFEVLGAQPVSGVAAPTLEFTLRASDSSGRRVYTVALRADLVIEPARRTYDAATRDRLVDLFGDQERWSHTPAPIPWARLDALVPSFRGSTRFTLRQQCSFDEDVAVARYCSALDDGPIPITFHLNGTIFHEATDGRLQLEPVPWDARASFQLPVSVWRATSGESLAGVSWVRLSPETVDRLARRRADRGLATIDAAIADLLGDEDPHSEEHAYRLPQPAMQVRAGASGRLR